MSVAVSAMRSVDFEGLICGKRSRKVAESESHLRSVGQLILWDERETAEVCKTAPRPRPQSQVKEVTMDS
jgi:hypothetical protein